MLGSAQKGGDVDIGDGILPHRNCPLNLSVHKPILEVGGAIRGIKISDINNGNKAADEHWVISRVCGIKTVV